MVALQNDRLRSMPASFLPPSPVSKSGTDGFCAGKAYETSQEDVWRPIGVFSWPQS